MKKSMKLLACVLVGAFICAVPLTASAKTHFSISLNLFDALPLFAAPRALHPPAPPMIVEQHVFVQPIVRPYPPPVVYHQRTIVREYYPPYFAYPTHPFYP